MLDFVLDSLKPQLAVLAEAWLTSGATAYGIWQDGRPLAQWPIRSSGSAASPPALVMPIHTDDATSLELRVVGAEGAAVQGRLKGEAALIADLIRREDELEDVTTRLIETQDQLLALYDLTHAARSHLSIQDTLNSLARESSRLLRTDGAFALLAGAASGAMPDGAPLVAQQPLPCLSSEQILGLFSRMQTDQQELLTNVDLETTGAAG